MKSVHRLLAQLPKPSPEQVESSRERVGGALQSHIDGGWVDEPIKIDRMHLRPLGRDRRWFAVAAASVAAIAAVVSVVVFFRVADSHALAEAADGALYRIEGTKSRIVQAGQSIRVGDLLTSGDDAGAAITLADGSYVEMRSRSQISLEEASDGVRIRLNKGSVIVTAARQRNGHLYVQTKDVTVAVIGTVFMVNAEESGSRVAVIQGEVEINHGTTRKKLRPGEQVATGPSMEWAPVVEEISWSRNKATHVALLQSQPKATDDATRLRFEVATIKPANPQSRLEGGSCHGTDTKYGGFLPITPPGLGRCIYRGMTVRALIQAAYDLRSPNANDMVSGGPGWTTSDRFDIETKAESPTTEADMRLMLRTLLEDRFKLKLHRETKDLPGFALLAANGGSKLAEATGNEDKPGIWRVDRSQPWTGRAVSLTQLAKFLSMTLNRTVVDETGLSGIYNFALTWTPGEDEGGLNNLNAMIARLPPEVQAQIPGRADPNGPSIFTALQEQLGLRLQARKVPTEIYVIDDAQYPSEN